MFFFLMASVSLSGAKTPYPEVSEKFITATNSPSSLTNARRSFDNSMSSSTKTVNNSVGVSPKDKVQTNESDSGEQESFVTTLSDVGLDDHVKSNKRQRSHTASEIEGMNSELMRGLNIEATSIGRGRSRSLGESLNRNKGKCI